MVLVNDFEIQIVSADDCKIPFKEHRKGSNTFVEVEPDAEYFISIRKVKTSATDLTSFFSVDGKKLGYTRTWGSKLVSASPVLSGIWTYSNNISTTTALKFLKASFVSEHPDQPSTMTGMGNIRLDVCRSIKIGTTKRKEKKSSFQVSSIPNENNARVTMKKDLRSGEGNISVIEASSSQYQSVYRHESILYSITLYYCATPGLIAVGVLPKPPLWDWQRMKNPPKTTEEERKKLEQGVLSVKRNRQGAEIVELRDEDSDDDDDDSDLESNRDWKNSSKKIKSQSTSKRSLNI